MKVENNECRWAVAVAIGAGLLTCAPNTWAQEAPITEGGLDEIVVTAAKDSGRSAQDVGISLQAITAESLEIRGVTDFRGYAEGLGSVSFADRGPGQQLVVVRGVNSSTTVVNTDEPEAQASVGVYLDETNVSLAGYNPDMELFDINRIEVLRGPQGTLFGAGSLSGAIRIITNQPDLNQTAAKTSITYSNTINEGESNYRVNGMVNYPLIDDVLALRVTGSLDRDGGFIDNVAPLSDPRHPLFGVGADTGREVENVNTSDTFNIRAQLRYAPGANFDANFKVIRQETELGGSQSEDTFSPAEPLPGNNPANAALGDYQQSRTNAEPYSDAFTLLALDAKWDLGFAELTSATSYLDRFQTNDIESSDFLRALVGAGFDTSTAILRNSTDVQDFSQEFRLNGDIWTGRLRYVAGVFYDQQDKVFIQDLPTRNLTADAQALGAADICELFAGAGNTCPALQTALGIPFNRENLFESTSSFDTRQFAVFGEISLDVTETLRLIAGARYFDYSQDFTFDQIGGIFTSGTTVDSRLEEDGVTPKVSLEYRPAEDLLFYTTASKGFRLGGSNDPVPVGLCGANAQTFNSDSLWSYELGAKTQFNDRIRLNGAVFHTDWSDVPISDILNGACGFKQTVNAGEVKIDGIEMDATLVLSEAFTLSLSGSYTDARFTQDVPGLVLPLIVSSDDALPMVPSYILGADLTYRAPMGGHGMFGVANINGNYRSSQYNQPQSSGGVELDGYGELNASLGIDSGDWSMSFFVHNLTDQRNVLFKDTIYLLENRDTVNRPRTIGVTLTSSF